MRNDGEPLSDADEVRPARSGREQAATRDEQRTGSDRAQAITDNERQEEGGNRSVPNQLSLAEVEGKENTDTGD